MSTIDKKLFSIDRTYPLSKALADARNSAGMTQLELADAIGTHKSHVSRWERGKFEPSSDYLEKISRVLNCSFVSTYGAKASISETAKRISTAREFLGNLTYDELSAIIGVGAEEIQSVENGAIEPSRNFIDAYSKAGVNPEWISTGRGPFLSAIPTADRRTIGERLRIALRVRDISQTQLAEGIDNSLSGVNLWVNDKREPRSSSLRAVADFLKVSPLWLRSGSGPMDSSDEYPGLAGPEPETEIDRRIAARGVINQDELVAEVNYLTKLVKEIKANGEEIPEAVRKRLIAAIDNLLDG